MEENHPTDTKLEKDETSANTEPEGIILNKPSEHKMK